MNNDKKNKCYICGKDRAEVNVCFIMCSWKRRMRSLMIIYRISTSCGITFIICIVWRKSPLRSLVGWSMRSWSVLTRGRMINNISVGYPSALSRGIKMGRKLKSLIKWWERLTVSRKIKSRSWSRKLPKEHLRKSKRLNDWLITSLLIKMSQLQKWCYINSLIK